MTQSPSVSVWTNARVTLVFLSMALMCLVFVLLFIVANEEDNKIISCNQCVLKNLKGGADRVATWEIVAACGRMFTKQLSIRLEGSAKFDSITHPTTFIVDLSNPDASHRITRFSVHVASSGPVLNGKQTGEFSWSSNINIEPH